jgi:hypothetical protein
VPAFTAFSAELDEELVEKYPSASPAPVVADRLKKRKVESEEKLKIYPTAYLLQGYDNNVNLNADRDKDGFLQSLQAVDYSYELLKGFKIRSGIEFFELIYYNYNTNNLFNMVPYVGFDWEFLPGLVLKEKVIYDYFAYPNYMESTYSGLEFSNYLRHYVTKDIYHEFGYVNIQRWYPEQKIYFTNFLKGDGDRRDARDSLNYNAAAYIGNRLYIKVRNEFYRNDSNEVFEDYYDYWAYRLSPSVIYFFTEKLYAEAGLVYKYRSYKDHRSTDDIEKKVRENTFTYNLSLYYNFMKNLAVGATYSYVENYPNDPFYEYSGSQITGGIYYTF